MSPDQQADPRFVGCCEVFDEIAEGGYATVYLARWLGVGGFAKTVALKRLHRRFASSKKVLTMFANEARIVARIRHPNVASTIDLVSHNNELFIVMDYVDGLSLSSLMQLAHTKGLHIPSAVALRLMLGVLAGLQAAHDLKDVNGNAMHVVHRDVSPENIIVGVDGYPRLLDFGVAKALGMASTTQQGEVKGKLAYMSPEQLAAKPVTPATDVFAASIVLWEMLTGTRLFKARNVAATAHSVLAKVVEPPSTHQPHLPKKLDKVVLRGLNRNPRKRWRSAREFAGALERSGRIASTLELVQWIRSFAQQELKERAELVRRIELTPIDHEGVANIRHAADDHRRRLDIRAALTQGTADEQRARATLPLTAEPVTRDMVPESKGSHDDSLPAHSPAPTPSVPLLADEEVDEENVVTALRCQDKPAAAKHRSTLRLPTTAPLPFRAISTSAPPVTSASESVDMTDHSSSNLGIVASKRLNLSFAAAVLGVFTASAVASITWQQMSGGDDAKAIQAGRLKIGEARPIHNLSVAILGTVPMSTTAAEPSAKTTPAGQSPTTISEKRIVRVNPPDDDPPARSRTKTRTQAKAKAKKTEKMKRASKTPTHKLIMPWEAIVANEGHATKRVRTKGSAARVHNFSVPRALYTRD